MQGLCGHSFHNHICSMQQMWAPASDARPECDWKCRENFLCINLGLFSHTTSVCSTTTEVSNRIVIISYTVLLTFRSIILFYRYYLLNIKSVLQRLSIIFVKRTLKGDEERIGSTYIVYLYAKEVKDDGSS